MNQAIANRIKEKIGKNETFFSPDNIHIIHDILMSEYGYIDFEEFKSLPITTVLGLFEAIHIRKENEERQMRQKR
jgi:hypothetical protein